MDGPRVVVLDLPAIPDIPVAVSWIPIGWFLAPSPPRRFVQLSLWTLRCFSATCYHIILSFNLQYPRSSVHISFSYAQPTLAPTKKPTVAPTAKPTVPPGTPTTSPTPAPPSFTHAIFTSLAISDDVPEADYSEVGETLVSVTNGIIMRKMGFDVEEAKDSNNGDGRRLVTLEHDSTSLSLVPMNILD